MTRRVFEPYSDENGTIEIFVDSSHNDKKDVLYKISYGNEIWDKTIKNVVKVQMIKVIDGKNNIRGRKVPSYPLEDMDAVIEAIEKIKVRAKKFDEKHS